MSRTYKKVLKLGICCGSNTEWYKQRRRSQRAKNRHALRKIRQMSIETFANECEFVEWPKTDDWREPTDGSWLADTEAIKKWERYIDSDDEYNARWGSKMYKKFAHQIKAYHNKNWR